MTLLIGEHGRVYAVTLLVLKYENIIFERKAMLHGHSSWDIFLIMSVKTENFENLLSIVSDYMF